MKQSLIGLFSCLFVLTGCTSSVPETTSDMTVPITSEVVNSTSDLSPEAECLQDDCLLVDGMEYPYGQLSPAIIEALNLAIEDEYKANTTYDEVIKKHGAIRPFIMIVRAEESHIASLKSIYDKYGVAIPENSWEGTIVLPNSVQEACAVGVVAEKENVRLYQEKLIPLVAQYPDIQRVFENLMNASDQKHLPAFEACS